MARVTIPLPLANLLVDNSDRLLWQEKDSGLGSVTALRVGSVNSVLTRVQVSSSQSFPSQVAVGDVGSLPDDPNPAANSGQELLPAWETNASAITYQNDHIDDDLVLPGPNHSSNTTRDSAENYVFVPSTTKRTESSTWITAWRELTDAQKGATRVILDDVAGTAPSFSDPTGDAISGTVGTAISPVTVPAATGSPAPAYAVHNNSLPDGLSFDPAMRRITGTPTAAGSGTITIRATNATGTADWTVAYSFTTATPMLPDASAPTPTIAAVAAGNEGTTVQLSATVPASDSTNPYDTVAHAWTVSAGTLDDATSATPVWTRPQVSADTTATIDLTITVSGTGTNAKANTTDTASAAQVSTTVRNVATPPMLPDAVAPTLALNAAAAQVNEGATLQLTPAPTGGTYDTASYAYEVVSGGGTVNASGLYTAPQVTADTPVQVRVTGTFAGTGTNAKSGTSAQRTATASFTVRDVPAGVNQPPVVVASIMNQQVRVGESVTVDVASNFSDPDGDTLMFSAMSSNENVATVSVSGSMVTVAGVATGTASITVTATDQ